MNTFKTLKNILEYIPNCILCGKNLPITVEGYLRTKTVEFIKIKCEVKDGLLRSKNKKRNLIISIEDNKILDGLDLLQKMLNSEIKIKKDCTTCHFKICTSCTKASARNGNNFPQLTLSSEEAHYTLKGGKDIQINKYYFSAQNDQVANIRLNNRYLPPMPWDFSKFQDLEHMNKRLSTIILFH